MNETYRKLQEQKAQLKKELARVQNDIDNEARRYINAFVDALVFDSALYKITEMDTRDAKLVDWGEYEGEDIQETLKRNFHYLYEYDYLPETNGELVRVGPYLFSFTKSAD